MAGGITDTGARRFSRIPPESTGDRMYMVHTAEIEYNGKQALDTTRGTVHEWKIGSHYDIGGAFGTVHVHGVYEKTADTGILAVHYNKTAKFENTDPEVAATISFGGDQKASVVASYDIMTPASNIMGYDNPEYGMDVDITGSANVRFAEGLPQLDAWGKLRVSGAQHLGDYVFGQQSVIDDNFSTVEIDGGDVSWTQDRKSARILIDTTASDYSGASAFSGMTSNTYHHYFPGSSHLYMSTASLNNPTATGSTRRWGMFDADNGFFFMVGTGGVNATDETGFAVVIRSSNTLAQAAQSPSSKDNIIPRSTWNKDKLDGTGDSQEILDLSKDNIWWIDVQWHGSGRVRFGTYVDGARVVCHEYYHGNRYAYSMTQTASLPVCFSNKSTGSTADDLYIETWSSSVWTETEMDLNESGKPSTFATNHTTITANISDNWQFIVALSPEELIEAGVVNHSIYTPTSISAYAFDNGFDGGTATPGKGLVLDAIIDLKAEINSIHSEHNFSLVPGTTIESSTAGTAYEGGQVVLQEMFSGRYEADLTDTYNNFQYGSVKNFSEDGGTKTNTLNSITAASPPVITTSDPIIALREPQQVTFPLNTNRYQGKVEITGSSVTDYNGTYYLKHTGLTTAELYTDSDLQTPANLSSAAAFTGTATLKGFYGSKVIWSFYAKTRTALHNDVKLMLTVNWKEVVQ